MSYFGTDPGDLSIDEMYGHTQADGVSDLRLVPCGGCRNPDGSLDTDRLNDEGNCTFGCGHRVNNDTKVCLHCGDHSANAYECEDCGTRYEKWGDEWEEMK